MNAPDLLSPHRTTMAWLRAGWPAPSEIDARLARIEDALGKLEAVLRQSR